MIIIRRFYLSYLSILWIIFTMLTYPVIPEIVHRVDPLAHVSGTLRTYQKAGCDSEQVSLSCPRGTSISIEVAQYGSTSGDGITLCPPSTEDTIFDAMHTGTEIEINSPENCLQPLQYSLLQNVVETCQKKSRCKFLVSPRSHGGDPCPTIRKFVEVAYKCRPYEFRSKVACENDVIQLVCNPYSRIAVYSASFGRTEYESIQCAQPQGVSEESCLASYGTETVMSYCHGRRRCTIPANRETFGSPCKINSRMYLKVVYTCIPRKVLKDQFDSLAEPDEPQLIDLDQDQDELYDEDQFNRDFDSIPPIAPKLHRELSNLGNTGDSIPETTAVEKPMSSANPPMRSRDSTNKLEENQERFYLYLIISVTAGVLLCLMLVIGRLILQKQRLKKQPKVQSTNTGDTTLPNGFSDDISEIDADIDLTTPISVPSLSRNDNFGIYTPSPSPYGNLGPSNLSHTSTTKLVTPNSILGGTPPAIIGTSNALIYPPSFSTPTGSLMTSYYPPNTYINGSIISQMGTIRRPREYECTPPRILSKIDADQQYYYG